MSQKIVDGHMHITQWVCDGERLVFDALRKYCENTGITHTDNMCCTNNGRLWEGYEPDQNLIGAIAKLECSNVFMHGCMQIPENPAPNQKLYFREQLEELMEIGIDGVKICDFKPDAYRLYRVGEHLEEYDEYIGLCEKYGVHMCWHFADPEQFWNPLMVTERAKQRGWYYGEGDHPTFDELIGLAYTFLDHHPNLKVLLAHAFFKSFEPDEVIGLLEKYPNVKIDLSLGWGMFNGFRTHYEKWHHIFRRFSDRFLFATDGAMDAPEEKLAARAQFVFRFLQTDEEFYVRPNCTAHGIKLDKSDSENIFYKNHESAVGKQPKTVNKNALKKYIERNLPQMPDTRNKKMTEEYYRKNLL